MTLRRLRGDAKRLTGALAFLRRGLRDGDDPLYDPWKLGQVGARATGHVPSPPRTGQAARRRLVFPRWSAIVFTSALLFAASAALLTLLSRSMP